MLNFLDWPTKILNQDATSNNGQHRMWDPSLLQKLVFPLINDQFSFRIDLD